jgi:hypothetical protein
MSATGYQRGKLGKKEEGGRRKEEGGRRKEEEENFFLCFSCFSYLVNGYIIYLSMHLHVLANVVMLNLLS